MAPGQFSKITPPSSRYIAACQPFAPTYWPYSENEEIDVPPGALKIQPSSEPTAVLKLPHTWRTTSVGHDGYAAM